jgi:aliphatic nitrilase
MQELRGLDAEARETLEQSPRGVSMVLGPSGEVISQTLCAEEGLLYHEIDLADCVEPKQFHDVAGYYNRFDVFRLEVNRQRLTPIRLREGDAPGAA